MTIASKRLIAQWPLAALLGLVCSFQALAHDYAYEGEWRPQHHHHHHEYQGWERPYYPSAAPPYYAAPPVYVPGPPRYVPVPPQVVIAAPPLRLEVPLPGWQSPRQEGWR